MICQNCGNKTATTHIKKIVNGIVDEKHLCSECAQKLGYTANSDNSFSGLLASMLNEGLPIKTVQAKECNCCGYTMDDIVKTGKVGCAKCYNTFREELLPYIKRIHGNVEHLGKIPNKSPLAVSTKEGRLFALKSELSILIKNEEFEKAAQVRDKIRQIEKEGESNG